MRGEGKINRWSLGYGAGKVHEQEGFKGIRMTAGEVKYRHPTGSGTGEVGPLQMENVEEGREEFGSRLLLAAFIGDSMAELAEEGHVRQPAGNALGARKQDEGETVPG